MLRKMYFCSVQSDSPQEVKLVEAAIEGRFVSKPPARKIVTPLDESLRKQYGTEHIAPYKSNR